MNYSTYKIKYQFDKKTGQVTAEVPSLNYLSSFGKNFKQAEANIKEAIQIYLEALAKEHAPAPAEDRPRWGTFIKVPMPESARYAFA